jgi:hypothetical protein
MVCTHDWRLVPGDQHPHPLAPSRKGRGNSHAVIFTFFRVDAARSCFLLQRDVPSEARCIDGLAAMRRFKTIIIYPLSRIVSPLNQVI